MKRKANKIKHAYVYVLLALLPIVSIVLIFYSLKYGIACLFGSFLINTIVYYRNKSKLENDLFSISYVAAVIHAGKRLASVNHSEFTTVCKGIQRKGSTHQKNFVFGSNIVAFGKEGGGDFDFIFEYIRILFLLDFISYNKIIKTISNHKEEYRVVWERIGELDAAIAVAFYRKSLDTYCTPIFIDKEEISFENMAHPLIDKPVTNTSTLGKCTLDHGLQRIWKVNVH